MQFVMLTSPNRNKILVFIDKLFASSVWQSALKHGHISVKRETFGCSQVWCASYKFTDQGPYLKIRKSLEVFVDEYLDSQENRSTDKNPSKKKQSF